MVLAESLLVGQLMLNPAAAVENNDFDLETDDEMEVVDLGEDLTGMRLQVVETFESDDGERKREEYPNEDPEARFAPYVIFDDTKEWDEELDKLRRGMDEADEEGARLDQEDALLKRAASILVLTLGKVRARMALERTRADETSARSAFRRLFGQSSVRKSTPRIPQVRGTHPANDWAAGLRPRLANRGLHRQPGPAVNSGRVAATRARLAPKVQARKDGARPELIR
ncbi:hypothetical protein HOG48_03470 [Candidatus Peregrinibacteria bacterium]|jgi:hypothetical protein|nr:hypothetical protein [Candidatus Peregrinibacteria bacterium]